MSIPTFTLLIIIVCLVTYIIYIRATIDEIKQEYKNKYLDRMLNARYDRDLYQAKFNLAQADNDKLRAKLYKTTKNVLRQTENAFLNRFEDN